MNYDKLPKHMQQGARDYIEKGIPPGSFMEACLANDLVGAFGRADHVNIEHMKDWANWLYMDCPRNATGSYEAVDFWCEQGGLEGLTKKSES